MAITTLPASPAGEIDHNTVRLKINEVITDATLDQEQMFYVSKTGDDSNSGLNMNEPKLTIIAAITAASLLTPAVGNQITIEVIDTGDYTESPTLPEWVHLDASQASLDGRLTVEDNTITSFRRLQNNVNNTQPVARKANGLGFAKLAVELLIVDGSSQEGLLVDAGVMHIDVGAITIDAGIGIKAKNGSRVSFIISEVAISNGGLGIGTRTAGGDPNFFSGNVLYAKDDGSGVFVEAKVVGDIINIQAGSLIVDTLYDMGAGTTLNVFATEATGSIITNLTATINATIAGELNNRVIVNKASDLSGALDSTKEYFIDGVIDMGSQSIEVPQGGLTLTGYSFDLSRLTSSEAAYTMFTSPVGGSGNIIDRDFAIEVTGASSQVYDLVGDTGFEAIEHLRINWNNCTSLGVIDNYRQGLETGTGRFGGTPELTLAGIWLGGYFIDTSIVRSLVNGSYSLFKAGVGFTMASRFRSNQNVDLPADASYLDFSTANFTNPSTLQLDGCIITRDGVADAEDTNITPNITEADLASSFIENQGMKNTFVGCKLSISAEAATTINTQGTFEVLAGTFNAENLVHFDNPTNGQSRNLGVSPRDFLFVMNIILEGPQNDEVAIRVRKFDFSTTSTSTVESQVRIVNNLSGGRNVAFFNLFGAVAIDQNDYIFLEVTDNTSTGDLTAEVDSFYVVTER